MRGHGMNTDDILDEVEEMQKEINKIKPKDLLKMSGSDRLFMVLNKNPGAVLIDQVVKLTGVKSAFFFSYLLMEERFFKRTNNLTKDGFFYVLSNNVAEKVFLSLYQQNNAIKKLKEHNLIETKFMGMPAKKYFKIIKKDFED